MIHALFIVIIFVLPEALLRAAIPYRTIDITWPMYAKSLITVSVFYANYFWVIPKTLIQRRQWWEFTAWNIALIVGGVTLIAIVYTLMYSGPRYFPELPHNSFSYILRDSIMLGIPIALAVALKLSSRWFDLENHTQKLSAIRKQTELDSLRSQLQPHFLFNTLNSIYTLIDLSPQEAQKAIHRLSALMRYLVYENPRKVVVDQEIEFIKNYVELMKLRMSNRNIEMLVRRHDDAGLEIAPLIFLSLVENAFKHGNTADPSLPIRIEITTDSRRVECTTENYTDENLHSHYPHINVKGPHHKQGVGINNLKRRLELVYGSDASFTHEIAADGTRIYRLSINAFPSEKTKDFPATL